MSTVQYSVTTKMSSSKQKNLLTNDSCGINFYHNMTKGIGKITKPNSLLNTIYKFISNLEACMLLQKYFQKLIQKSFSMLFFIPSTIN